MQAQEARPPYVTFEIKAEEDRAASIEAGYYIARDVVYAVITPQGSKDRIERQVDDWFASMAQQVQEGRLPQEWLSTFRAKHKAWVEGQEMPENGTSVRSWPAVSPAQVAALLAAHVLTVEDLAAANEETIMRLGMGGRALKQRAMDWIAAAAGTGKTAEKLSALEIENQALRDRNESLGKQVAELAVQVKAMMARQAQPA